MPRAPATAATHGGAPSSLPFHPRAEPAVSAGTWEGRYCPSADPGPWRPASPPTPAAASPAPSARPRSAVVTPAWGCRGQPVLAPQPDFLPGGLIACFLERSPVCEGWAWTPAGVFTAPGLHLASLPPSEPDQAPTRCRRRLGCCRLPEDSEASALLSKTFQVVMKHFKLWLLMN